ncbi:MAG: hypothetical protein ACFB15_30845 [Cyclobacteriaceae bacterium]
MSTNLKRKVRLTNMVALLTLLIGVVYSGILYLYFPSLVIYPLGCLVGSLVVLALNFYGATTIARFICSFQMLLFTTLFHAYAIQPGEHVITSLYLSQFAMGIIPFLLYDFKEKGELIATLVICYAIILGQQGLNVLLDAPGVNADAYRESILSPLTYFFAVVISVAGGALISLGKSEKVSEVKKVNGVELSENVYSSV